MTDENLNPTTPEPDPAPQRDPAPRPDPDPDRRDPAPDRPPSSARIRTRRPDYRGEELDPERGPGLGCFWFQVIVLGFFFVLIPVGLNLSWPFEVLAILLFIVIGLLLLTGQTVIFLLRLVAADRRAQGRRRPLASPTRTVGELEDEHRVAHAVGGARPVAAGVTDTDTAHGPADGADAADSARADAADSADHAGTEAEGAPAPEAVIRDHEVLGTPAAGDLGPEPEGESDAGDASDAPARPTEGDAAAPGGAAGDGEGPPAARMHESPPGGRRQGWDLAAATATAAATDEFGPEEPPEEPDPGVRQ